MLGRNARKIALLLALGNAVALPQMASASAEVATPLTRWFGAEAGFDEVACWGTGIDCPGFGAVFGLGGDIDGRPTGLPYRDPDGVSRAWPARTGNRLYLAETSDAPNAGGAPGGYAYLTTFNSQAGAFAGGTVSFAIRAHTPPPTAVVIFEHMDAVPARTISVTLSPDGRLVALSGGRPLGTTGGTIAPWGDEAGWHVVTMSYAAAAESVGFRLQLDGGPEVEATLPNGGPSGHAALGIVRPIAGRFAIGIDDYVESPRVNAPIAGARINYLMPHGTGSLSQWTESNPWTGCRDRAENWQFVSEDQWLSWIEHDSNGVPFGRSCKPAGTTGGDGVKSAAPGLVDEYVTEGVPSVHVRSALLDSYERDVTLQPRYGESVLGVRVRMSAQVGDLPFGESVTWSAGFVDAGQRVMDSFSFVDVGTSYEQWGRTSFLRPSGAVWTAATLDSVVLRLDSGRDGRFRHVRAIRLDYVWVPASL